MSVAFLVMALVFFHLNMLLASKGESAGININFDAFDFKTDERVAL